METETFSTLVRDLAHWEFELFVSVVFMIMEGLIFWPIVRMILRHHKGDDKDIAALQKRVEALEKRKSS